MRKIDRSWSKPFGMALAILVMSLPLYSQEASRQDQQSDREKTKKAFSGPQPGERLPPLPVRIVLGDNAGEDVDIVSAAKGKPMFLILMNAFGETVNEMMRVITLYAEQRNTPDLTAAVVWMTSDPNELEARLKRARPHMPNNTPVGMSLEGPEGPGAYGLNRHMQMTILIADDGVVTSNFALVQPSIKADSVAVLRELVKVIGGKPPTIAEITNPRDQQIVATRIEIMVDQSTTDERVQQIASILERFVRTRRAAKITLGQLSSEIVQSGRYKNRKKAIGYFRKWAKQYEKNN